MEKKYFIYKLTNIINGKIYIGKTKRKLCSRMSDHRYFAKKRPNQPISRSIAKYGWENFNIDILKVCSSEKEMNVEEIKYIRENKSTDPLIGYNICTEEQDHRFSNSKYFKDLEKHASQGRKSMTSKYSKYIGTRLWNNKWYCQCTINGKNISKLCNNEHEAAILYDKICLFHYGKQCKLNFDEKRKEYLNSNLQKIFDDFMNNIHTSKEEFICYDSTRNGWIFSKKVNGKKIFKRFKTEQDAINFKYNINK